MKRYLSLLLLYFIALAMHAQFNKVYRIYAGPEYEDYLGCFASPYKSESIFNNFCQYGNEFSSKSIWNKFSKYGNEYNSYSPWNEYSSKPPVLVDENMRIVDYFSCSYKASEDMRKLMLYIKKHFDEVAKDPCKFYIKYLE